MTVPSDFDLFYREGMAFGEQFAQDTDRGAGADKAADTSRALV
jgi:hypothetical protein